MRIEPITVQTLTERGGPLFRAHHAAVAQDLSADDRADELLHPPLSIDSFVFAEMERVGLLVAFGLWEGDELRGYAIATVTRHQYAEQIVASGRAIFIREDARGRGACGQLMDAVEAEARERGAVGCEWHAKKGSRFARILAMRGAKELETIYLTKL